MVTMRILLFKRWGGEIVYDNYKAIINRHAGSDRGVEILYGKNNC